MNLRTMALGSLLALLVALPALAEDTPPYLDPAQPIEARVADLVGRLEVKEKIDLLSSTAPAVERLGIPEYDYWNESLHGVARAGRATVFPQAIGMAATFDPDLVGRVATAISDEARAKHNASVRAGMRQRYRGLTFWTPNINIFRDPRWGRGQETYGEDPYLMAQMGTAYVRGLQGDDPRYLKAAACAKHYAVHSGPEGNRHSFDAIASPKELNETYLPAFEALVGAGVEIVMCAYNRTNGDPCCSSEFLLQETLRDDWGFDGHVVSDCGAVDDLHAGHKVTKDAAESAAATLKAGTDLACTSYAALHDAFERKLVTEADLDRALGRVLRTRFRLGFFDPEDMVPWSDIPETRDRLRCAPAALPRGGGEVHGGPQEPGRPPAPGEGPADGLRHGAACRRRPGDAGQLLRPERGRRDGARRGRGEGVGGDQGGLPAGRAPGPHQREPHRLVLGLCAGGRRDHRGRGRLEPARG